MYMGNENIYDDATIEELLNNCENLLKMVEELKAENSLLTDVILRHRLASEVQLLRKGIRPESSAEMQAEEFKKQMHIE